MLDKQIAVKIRIAKLDDRIAKLRAEGVPETSISLRALVAQVELDRKAVGF